MWTRRGATLVAAAALLAGIVALGIAAARGPAPARSLDDRVHQVASRLRCPVCQDLSVADSPSLVAKQIRSTIARRLRAGQTPAEIEDYFVARFGESILLAPPARGIDVLAWIVPALLVAAGLGALGLALRRWAGAGPAPEPTTLTAEERDAVDRELRMLDGEPT
jgi:cytochrome c-type biogenesis protein CcmH